MSTIDINALKNPAPFPKMKATECLPWIQAVALPLAIRSKSWSPR